MTRKEREALQRLEEALLAQEAPVSEDAILEETWLEHAAPAGTAYNSDQSDVDLDAYSEEVRRGHSGNPLGVVLALFTIVLLAGCVLFLLKMMGVL